MCCESKFLENRITYCDIKSSMTFSAHLFFYNFQYENDYNVAHLFLLKRCANPESTTLWSTKREIAPAYTELKCGGLVH